MFVAGRVKRIPPEPLTNAQTNAAGEWLTLGRSGFIWTKRDMVVLLFALLIKEVGRALAL